MALFRALTRGAVFTFAALAVSACGGGGGGGAGNGVAPVPVPTATACNNCSVTSTVTIGPSGGTLPFTLPNGLHVDVLFPSGSGSVRVTLDETAPQFGGPVPASGVAQLYAHMVYTTDTTLNGPLQFSLSNASQGSNYYLMQYSSRWFIVTQALQAGATLSATGIYPQGGSVTHQANTTREYAIVTSSSYPQLSAYTTNTNEATEAVAAAPDGTVWALQRNYYSASAPWYLVRVRNGAVSTFPLPTAGLCHASIAVAKDNTPWFTECGKNAVAKFTGSVVGYTLPTAASYPHNIVAGSDGRMWVDEGGWLNNQNGYVGSNGDTIAAIDLNGAITEYNTGICAMGVTQLVAGSDGAIWFPIFRPGVVSCNGSVATHGVGRIDTLGNFSQLIPTVQPYSLVDIGGGSMVYSDGALGILNSSGNVTFSDPGVVCGGATGQGAWCSDSTSIYQVTVSGLQLVDRPPFVTSGAGNLGPIDGSDANGRIYMHDNVNDLLYQYDPNSKVLVDIGLPTAGIATTPAFVNGTAWYGTSSSNGMIYSVKWP